MTDALRMAPGWPGIAPRWTTSNKTAVGTAIGDGSRVWFTASHGILNEIYYPEVDSACLRDAGLLITSDDGLFYEEKRDCTHVVEWLAPGVPAFRLRSTANDGSFEIEKRICTSPDYDVVLQHVRFTPHRGTLSDYRLTLLVSPHLDNHGAGNTGWVGVHKGQTVLCASLQRTSLAVACTAEMRQGTVTLVGEQDVWHDVREHGKITRIYDRAENGNIALAAEVDLVGSNGEFTIAIGLGGDADTAAHHARGALFERYDAVERRYASDWFLFQQALQPLDEAPSDSRPHLYRASAAVMKTHMTMNCDGGAIASLSVPWGSTQGDGNLGGYHLVWPRDMVETAGGLLAAGAHNEMKAMLRFLAVTQEADGHWPQNMWVNGTPFWNGLQLDEMAFPILLVDHARRENAITDDEVGAWWTMVQRAAVFVALHGPATEQDRWEENAGYAPFTLAVSIAALLAASELAERAHEPLLAMYLRDTADDWNASIEDFTYVTDTELSRQIGVDGYYVRIGSANIADASAPARAILRVQNRSGEQMNASSMVSVDALALVRFGLRSAQDARIRNTVRVIDAQLCTETNAGPSWIRYSDDGYGEHADGSAFDGSGIGRGWPLLVGERAHYEIAAGNFGEASRLAAVMRAQASEEGLLPEQIWNAPDIVERSLFNGQATGSAMPLVWAHAEYVKLLRSLQEHRVYDCPPYATARYVERVNVARVTAWRLSRPVRAFPTGRTLRIDASVPVMVRWTSDAWERATDSPAQQLSAGVYAAELPTASLPTGSLVQFTVYWPDEQRWQGEDFSCTVV